MRTIIFIALSAGSVALVGCGGGETEQQSAPRPTAGAERAETERAEMATHPGPMHGGHGRGEGMHRRGMRGRSATATPHAESCPMQIPGVSLRAEDIEGGVALVFTTTEPDEVAALQQSVRAMAPTHAQQPASAEGLILEPSAELTVVDLPDGARLDLRAEDPRDVASLRRQGRMRADLMIRGACPLLLPQQASLGVSGGSA